MSEYRIISDASRGRLAIVKRSVPAGTTPTSTLPRHHYLIEGKTTEGDEIDLNQLALGKRVLAIALSNAAETNRQTKPPTVSKRWIFPSKHRWTRIQRGKFEQPRPLARSESERSTSREANERITEGRRPEERNKTKESTILSRCLDGCKERLANGRRPDISGLEPC